MQTQPEDAPRKILVQKFGGSSLSSFQKLKAVAERLAATKKAGYDVVVVVSAMGNTTNDLLERAHEITAKPARRELDMLLSVGERISMALLSMAIHEHGLEATSLTGSQCGIITTDSHSNARIIDVRPFRVQDELAKGKIVIVAGYQGTSYRREVTTLGRGGSDTTAVALAAALGAECQIYSDVDGVFTADPRVVLDAHKLEQVSYSEMVELARAGARVLNEEAVAFAKRAKIALYARSTHMPNSEGTVIRPDGFDERAKDVERGRPEVVAIAAQKSGLFVRGDVETLLDATADYPSVASVIVGDGSEKSWNFIPTTDIHDLPEAVAGLKQAGLTVEESGYSAVSVIGDGVGAKLKWFKSACDLLKQEGIHILATSVQYARLTFIVELSKNDESVVLLHRLFIH